MKAKKNLTKVLCLAMVLNNVLPAMAVNTEQSYTYAETDTNVSKETEVVYNNGVGNYFVRIPKIISLGADKQCAYSVEVKGDISSDKQVYVSPIDSITDTDDFDFYMTDQSAVNKKENVVATVSQNKFYWNFKEAVSGYVETKNSVTAQGLSAGKWKGTFDFEINMTNINGDESHKHSYIETVTKEPTCTEEGEKELTCDCGDTKTETVPAAGHNIVDGNCTECDVIVKTVDDLIAGDISYDMGTVLAVKKADTLKVNDIVIPEQNFTFDEEGEYKVTVETTDESTGQPIIININITIIINQQTHTHNYTETIIKNADCTEDGEKKLTCSCGDSKTETIPATGHDYENGKCTECGEADPDYNVVDPYLLAPEDAYKNWDYTLDEANNTITLNYYTGSETDVIVYANYPVNGTVYNTKIASNTEGATYFLTPYMFNGGKQTNCKNIQSIKFSKGIDTSNVTNMSCMFSWCTSLTNLDISNFDTSNVTNMFYMFGNCNALTDLDISNFDTSNVTNMSNMFPSCRALTNLDVSKWNTNNVTDMSGIFYNCEALTNLDVSKWNTNNVTTMSSMFAGCKALTNLDVSNFDTSKVTDMRSLFHNCNSLTSLDVSNFDTNKVTDMEYMFCYCESLTSLDLSSFNTSNVTNMRLMFGYSSKLTTIYVSKNKWSTSKASITDMFKGCGTSSVTYK